MVTTNLDLATLSNGQGQPEQTHNDALNHLAFFLTRATANIAITGASGTTALSLTASASQGSANNSINGNLIFNIIDDGVPPTVGHTLTIPDGCLTPPLLWRPTPSWSLTSPWRTRQST